MNPNQFLQKMLSNNQVLNNPMVINAMNLVKNNDVNGLQKLAENIAQSKGTTIDDVRKQIGI